uniref:rRNA-processing protein FYV7 n=1 Tax=Trieres chinensis TaxID=1514140 RepID=A0A7S1YXB1_TRICV|mmetsp:Transcript_12480/g.25922  ORF Transcript_12480/g.25922 Transcript_12480/m.25922 type:complete len:188 (+) Transcript_12480:39-602(+)
MESGSKNSSETQRCRRIATGGGGFSSRQTATTRSLQEFRRRKEKKFVQNATLLREYRRAVKSEGYEAGRGASRKRGRGDEDENRSRKENISEGQKDAPGDELGEERACRRKRRKKTDPFTKAKAQAEARKKEKEDAIAERKRRQKEEVFKAQKRKKQYKKMTQRTKRGQPVMKNVIGSMLEKIQRDV